MKINGYLLPIALLATVSASSRAEDGAPLHFFVGQEVKYDSNYFRLPDGVDPSAAATGVSNPPRSETLFNTYAGLGFDNTYGRQHLLADLSVTYYAHRTYKYLDFTGVTGRAAWNWAIGNRWDGTLSYKREQAPANYSTFTGFRTDSWVYTRAAADANYWWHSNWSAGVGAARVTSGYGNSSVEQFRDYDADIADARITYRPSSGNEVRLLVRRTDGSYSNVIQSPSGLLAAPFTQYDYLSDAKWVLDGHSRVSGQVGYSTVSYTAGAARFRDFAGPTGRLAYDWTPTGKTSFNFLLRRDIGPEPQDALNASFVATSAASVTAEWAASSKVSFRGLAQWRQREPGGETGAVDSALLNTTQTHTYSVTGNWKPDRRLSLGATVGRETRTGDNPVYPNFDDYTVSGKVEFLFR